MYVPDKRIRMRCSSSFKRRWQAAALTSHAFHFSPLLAFEAKP